MKKGESQSNEDDQPADSQKRSHSPPPSFIPPPIYELQELIPAYEFLEFIDRGGMGAVYKARQPHLDRMVAVKLLPPSLAEDASFEKRFRREAKTMAKLNHPNIVSVHDFGETTQGHLYIVMEYIEGSDLRHMIFHRTLKANQILPIINQVCDALQYAHDHGIVHRDIKPANILFDKNGVVKVADFGLAKPSDPDIASELSRVSMPGVSVGTPAYMAPEALEDTEIDHRADIYSFGVVIYEMLTGGVPMGAWQPPSKTNGTDQKYDDVVNRAMQANREDRFQQAGDISHAFDSEQFSVDGTTLPPSPAAKTNSLRTPLWIALGALILTILGTLAFSWNGESFSFPGSGGKTSNSLLSTSEFEAVSREMAAWVFTKGGFVQIRTSAEDIYSKSDLPDGVFEIWRISLEDQTGFTDTDLKKLVGFCERLPEITNLNLHSTSITTAGTPELSRLAPQLRRLNLSSTGAVDNSNIAILGALINLELLILSKEVRSESGETIPITYESSEQLGSLLPDCEILWES